MPRRPPTGPAEEAPPAEVRVAVVHGRPLERGHIGQAVEVLAGYRVVLSVARGEEVLKALRTGAEVEVALVYVAPAATTAFTIMGLLRDACPGIGLVALAENPEVPLTARAYCAGARAVLDLLATEPEGLRAAVAAVRGGHLHLNAVLDRMLRERGPRYPAKASEPPVKLTKAEKLILCLMRDPILTERGIAEEVNRAESTVHSHIKNIYAKLGAHSWREALRNAAQYGVLPG